MNDEKDDDLKTKNNNSFTKPKSFLKSSNPKPQNQANSTKLATPMESEEFGNDVKENDQNETNRNSLSNKYSDDFDDENKDNNLPKLSLDNNSTNSSTLLSSKYYYCLLFLFLIKIINVNLFFKNTQILN
jgi:hypothetical protein